MKEDRTHHIAAAAIVAQTLVAALVIALLAPVAAFCWLVSRTAQALQHHPVSEGSRKHSAS